MDDYRKRLRRAWDAVADDYAAGRDADGEDAALIDDLVAGLPPDPTVLDVGCGDGARTLANMAGVRAVGVDISARQLELAGRTVPSADLLQGEMTALPVATDSVDAVTAYHAVFHVPRERHPAVYGEFARVLKPGGVVLATVGRGRTETTRRNWLDSGHAMFWSTPGRSATRAQLREAGFSIDWERSVDDPLGSSALFVRATL